MRSGIFMFLLGAAACGGPASRVPSPAAPEQVPAQEEQPRVPSVPERAARTARADTARPVFEIEMWPGEGVPVFESTGTPLTLRERPSLSANVSAVLRLNAGERIAYDDTRYQTIQPASVRVLRDGAIEGRLFGAVMHVTQAQYYSDAFLTGVVPVAAGEQLLLLQHRAEGTCFVKIASRVVEAEACPTFDDEAYRASGEPMTQWWVHVPGTQSASGWLLVTDASVRQLPRSG